MPNKSKTCPECKKRFSYASVLKHKYFPFCSEPCKNIDLARWFEGEYGVVEDLAQGLDLKAGGLDPSMLDDPDVRAALDDL
ncbi:MAG: DNA gyrase inhibitor YacG [Planctomycetota bacterium]|jgi:endogenous inhibitor of DNA gyrase (YacG/DUF329 family)